MSPHFNPSHNVTVTSSVKQFYLQFLVAKYRLTLFDGRATIISITRQYIPRLASSVSNVYLRIKSAQITYNCKVGESKSKSNEN